MKLKKENLVNETLDLQKQIKSEKAMKLKEIPENIDLSENYSTIKDMQTIIKDTKEYLEKARKGLENGK